MTILIILLLLAVQINGQIAFIATGYDNSSTYKTMASSLDGVTWTPIVQNVFSAECNGIAYSIKQNKWLAVGTYGINNHTMAYSSDGLTWIGMQNLVFPTKGNKIIYTETRNLWVAVGPSPNSIATSADGITWNFPTSPFDTQGLDVAYSDQLGRWVAVGGRTRSIAYSSDAITWTGIITAASGIEISAINFSPQNTKFITAGFSQTHSQAYSINGVNWFGNSLNLGLRRDVDFGQNKWIMVAESGGNTLITSTVGNSWTNVSQPHITNAQGILYDVNKNIWIVAGSNPGSPSLMYSNNGVNWTSVGGIAGFPFGTAGYHIASRNIPSNIVTTNITGTVTLNATLIQQNTTININANLTILGDFFVLGRINIGGVSGVNTTDTTDTTNTTNFSSSPTLINITGQLFVNNEIVITTGQITTQAINISTTLNTTILNNTNSSSNGNALINCDTLLISPNTNLTVFISDQTVDFNVAGTTLIPVINYNSVSGRFQLRSAIISPISSNFCPPQITQDYSSSTLSILVSIIPLQSCSNNGGTNDGGTNDNSNIASVATITPINQAAVTNSLSTDAIIGIAVGASVVGILVVFMVMFLSIRHTRNLTRKSNEKIKAKAMAELRRSATTGVSSISNDPI